MDETVKVGLLDQFLQVTTVMQIFVQKAFIRKILDLGTFETKEQG